MIQLQGYNTKLKKKTDLFILRDGVLMDREWKCIKAGSVKRCTDQKDMNGNLLFEDDAIIEINTGNKFVVCYGTYEIQWEDETMQTVGFYIETADFRTVPLGNTDRFIKKECTEKYGE